MEKYYISLSKYEEINIFKDVLKNNKIHSIYENILYKLTNNIITK